MKSQKRENIVFWVVTELTAKGRPHQLLTDLSASSLLLSRDGLGLWVSDFGRVGSGHGSVCQIWCLTRF